MYTVQCILYNVHCILHTVHCTLVTEDSTCYFLIHHMDGAGIAHPHCVLGLVSKDLKMNTRKQRPKERKVSIKRLRI